MNELLWIVIEKAELARIAAYNATSARIAWQNVIDEEARMDIVLEAAERAAAIAAEELRQAAFNASVPESL